MAVFNTDFYTHIDVKRFTGHNDEVNCVAFSADFEMLVTGSDDELTRVFNTATGKMVVELRGQKGAIRCVAVSPDSRYIASGSFDKTVIVYRTCDAEGIHKLTAHLKSVESVTFSPCSLLLCSTSWDRTGILWQVETGHMLRLFEGHKSLVQCSTFSPCMRMLATGSWDYTVRVWPLKRSARGEHIQELKGHTSNVHSVVFSCHNILATGGWDKQVILWNPYTAEILHRLLGHEGWVQALCFSQDGYLLVSAADDESVKIWGVSNGICLKSLESRTEGSAHCGFHPSGALVASGAAMATLAIAGTTHTPPTNQNEPPHNLNGAEILDKQEVTKRRAQSARPARSAEESSGEGSVDRKSRPKTATVGKQHDMRPTALSNVEKWLTSSFPRL